MSKYLNTASPLLIREIIDVDAYFRYSKNLTGKRFAFFVVFGKRRAMQKVIVSILPNFATFVPFSMPLRMAHHSRALPSCYDSRPSRLCVHFQWLKLLYKVGVMISSSKRSMHNPYTYTLNLQRRIIFPEGVREVKKM